MNSRDIAKKFGKRNPDINRVINSLLKKNPELSSHFVKSSYTSSRNRIYSCYILDNEASDILATKFKFNVRSARLEYKIVNEIKDFLTMLHIEYLVQYCVLNYRIDIYIPNKNIAVEIDENEHKYKKGYDSLREQEIKCALNCSFIRIDESDSCGSALAKIAKSTL